MCHSAGRGPGRNQCRNRTAAARICAERPMALLPDCRNRVGVTRARALRVALALAALAASGAPRRLGARDESLGEEPADAEPPGARRGEHVPRRARSRRRCASPAALDSSARQHSLEMGRLGYFAHSSADGTAFWKRIRHYYTRAGLRVLVGRREPPLGLAERERRRRDEDVDREPRASEEPADRAVAPDRRLSRSRRRTPRASSTGCPSRSSPPTSASAASAAGALRRAPLQARRARRPRGPSGSQRLKMR